MLTRRDAPGVRPAPFTPRHRVAIGCAALVIVLVCALVGLRVAAPAILRARALAAARKGCPTCTFAIGSVQLSLLRGDVTLHDVAFEQTPAEPVAISFRAARLDVNLAPFSLFTGTVHIRHALATDVHFRVVEDPRIRPPPAQVLPPPILGAPPLLLDGADIVNGTFQYAHAAVEREPTITIDRIDGHVGGFGTRQGLGPARISMHGVGRFEGHGRAELTANGDLFSMRGDTDLTLDLRGQPAADLNGYLAPTEHIRVHGSIEHAHAEMHLVNGRITGRLVGTYDGLEAQFGEAPGRSQLLATVTNIGAHFLLRHDVVGRSVGIEGRKDLTQPITQALWFALRAAGQNLVMIETPLTPPAVASGPTPRPAATHGGGPDVPASHHHDDAHHHDPQHHGHHEHVQQHH